MTTGLDFLKKAKTKLGCKYVLGIVTPKNDPKACSFDCAEFTSWTVYQVMQKLYGCANNNGHPASADAYSGFWGRDANNGTLIKIPLAEALVTQGALLLRLAGNGQIGHIVWQDGRGKTIEAHSTRTGVIESVVTQRRWDFGILIPEVDYTVQDVDSNDFNKRPDEIYRYKVPMMHNSFIKLIQKAVGMTGKQVDGWYGAKTFTAVREFQIKRGLVPDGEAGPKTLKALKLI